MGSGRPSALTFMARAFLPSPGLPRDGSFPRVAERWAGFRIEREHLAQFRDMTGLGGSEVSILVPHVYGFRLQMELLTRREYPLPIWNALQIRNRLVRHRHIPFATDLDLEAAVSAHRRVDKGLEVDIGVRLAKGSSCCWESVVTYLYRGRYGEAGAIAPGTASPDISGAPVVHQFAMPRGGSWGFGRMTGDYNGIHQWSWYARRFGFRAAFAHPQRTAGLCMAQLREPPGEAQSLDLWIKGPAYYGANAVLRASDADGETRFGVFIGDDSRSAVVGRWYAGEGVPPPG